MLDFKSLKDGIKDILQLWGNKQIPVIHVTVDLLIDIEEKVRENTTGNWLGFNYKHGHLYYDDYAVKHSPLLNKAEGKSLVVMGEFRDRIGANSES